MLMDIQRQPKNVGAVYPCAMGGLADLERCVSSQENLREKVRALTEYKSAAAYPFIANFTARIRSAEASPTAIFHYI